MDGEGGTFTGSKGERRLQNTEFAFPIVVGTVAFFLGKKATEYESHKWTLYVRGADNQDITHVIKKVTFQLHPSFQNPNREVFAPPFELTEVGWGEFEIAIQLHFADDAFEEPVELFHKLKLYSETEVAGHQNPKKPVVAEEYEELVFSEPAEEFYNRVTNITPEPAPALSIAQYTLSFDPQLELQKIAVARQRVAHTKANIQRQLEALT
ncbi:hypothetical protein WJX72_008474 [[Myrmecia] bisecta]|uniref:YEATS domain-containing protein n=1 Tax=[Myrmecia] bisecta TaxID=41462 RepID=A0AAW1PPA1_9CHLO